MRKVLQLMQDEYVPVICGNAFVADHFRMIMDKIGVENYIWLDNKDRPMYEKLSNGAMVFNSLGNHAQAKRDLEAIVKSLGINIVIAHDPEFGKAKEFLAGTDCKAILVSHYYAKEQLEECHHVYDKIIVFQKDQYDRYVADSAIPKEKLFYMPQPMDTHIFRPYSEVNTKERSLLYFGRIIEQKGCHLIIPYLKRLNASYTMIGPVKDQSYLQSIIDLAKEYDVQDRVQHIDSLTGETLAKAVCEHQIFILQSSSDCYSLSLSEALCCGLTCAVLDIPDAFTWAKDMVHRAKNMDDLVSFVEKALDQKAFMSHAEYMTATTSLGALSPSFDKMLQEVYELPEKVFKQEPIIKPKGRFQWKGL